MKRRHLLAAGAGLVALAAPARAQAVRPPAEIRLMVGFAAGGATDLLARRLQPLFEQRGHRLIVENLPGGGSTIALARVANARPDGTMIGFASGGLLALVASGDTPLRLNQFANLIRISQDPSILVVGATSPLRTLDDVISAMKGQRGGFTAGAAGPEGTLGHLNLVAFAGAVGAEFVYVGYPGASRLANELIGGHIQAGLVKPADVFGQIRSGELRPVAQFADERLKQLPDVPTTHERGIDVFPHGRMVQMTYAVAPAAMPAPMRAAITALIRDCVLTPEFQAVAAQDAFIADALEGAALDAAVTEMFEGFKAAQAQLRKG